MLTTQQQSDLSSGTIAVATTALTAIPTSSADYPAASQLVLLNLAYRLSYLTNHIIELEGCLDNSPDQQHIHTIRDTLASLN